MYDWLQEEVLDLEAMLDAIASLIGLENKKHNISANLASYEEVLKDLNAGKTNIKTMFTFKNKEEDRLNYERKKNNVNFKNLFFSF